MRVLVLVLVAGFLHVLNSAELPTVRHAFTVIAHRGNHSRAHENTLTALRHAMEAGVDYAEIDVRCTADGHYVLMHDSTVDRTTDGSGKVARLTLAQVQALRVRDPERPQIPPDRVPTLGEALALAKGGLNLYLDFKAGDRAAVAKVILEAGVQKQVLVYDEPGSAQQWRRVIPSLPLIVSPPTGTRTPGELVDFARRARIQVLDGDWKAYTREMVEVAGNAGVRVWPDIQDQEEGAAYFARVVDRGFTGAQTDHPEQLIAWLKEKGRR